MEAGFRFALKAGVQDGFRRKQAGTRPGVRCLYPRLRSRAFDPMNSKVQDERDRKVTAPDEPPPRPMPQTARR